MFVVFDNGKPARFPDHKVDPSWNTASFTTLVEAKDYAVLWLGRAYSGVLPDDWDGSKIDYSGYGDMIEIREE